MAKPKVISEVLEHSGDAFTMDVYSHIIEGRQQDAMMLPDGVLPKAKNGVLTKKQRQINASIRHKINQETKFSFNASVAQG
ncbi:MAG: hypothetical protein V3T06_03910 [Dehalococcoidia bacterium]